MKVAITTSNGKSIDMHFGKSNYFYIYKLVNGGLSFVEKRDTISYSSIEETPYYNEDRFDKVYQVIKDCRFLYTAKIGNVPANMLRRKGIFAEVMECEIENLM